MMLKRMDETTPPLRAMSQGYAMLLCSPCPGSPCRVPPVLFRRVLIGCCTFTVPSCPEGRVLQDSAEGWLLAVILACCQARRKAASPSSPLPEKGRDG